MESPPAAVAPCSAALASSKGGSVCRAARTRACAARSALSSATRATGAAFARVCVAQVQSGLANFNATAWISQQQWSGRWPVFLQTPPRVAPASARFLPLIIRFPWAISLHFCQAWPRLLQLGHVGSFCCLAGRARACTASECPARSRTRARNAPSCGEQLQPWRKRRAPAGGLAAPPTAIEIGDTRLARAVATLTDKRQSLSEQSETESTVDAARAQASHVPTRQT